MWVDGLCLAASSVPVYESIKALHTHLDDDKSGEIDLSESVDVCIIFVDCQTKILNFSVV